MQAPRPRTEAKAELTETVHELLQEMEPQTPASPRTPDLKSQISLPRSQIPDSNSQTPTPTLRSQTRIPRFGFPDPRSQIHFPGSGGIVVVGGCWGGVMGGDVGFLCSCPFVGGLLRTTSATTGPQFLRRYLVVDPNAERKTRASLPAYYMYILDIVFNIYLYIYIYIYNISK